ncbi:Druantia anti-phage system protein DruA [Nocardia sp. NPDC051321]|uniref:Druantia anti-phage system protein DruA n=1 Tax=Nocardia sp. NPDC051321 TaxID=3364323 RepID=UPI00379953EA
MTLPDPWLSLPIPTEWTSGERRQFRDFCQVLAGASSDALPDVPDSRNAGPLAAMHLLHDLVNQGWELRAKTRGAVAVAPPAKSADPQEEKYRVQRQEIWKRNEQLMVPSVRRFIKAMEQPRMFRGSFVSIFSLMRDGGELADSLRIEAAVNDPTTLRGVVDPYVQVISGEERCEHTGLRLMDIWRYFRHTWSNQYVSTPGRTMMILVRDRAAPWHPIIGIAALGSAIMQLSQRDEWIGWQSDQFVRDLIENPSAKMARWVLRRLQQYREELYLDDLLDDGLYWPSLWDAPNLEAVDRLVKEADARRRDHHRFVRRSDFKHNVDADDWRRRAETDLYRSKRCLALADLLRARAALKPLLDSAPTKAALAQAMHSRDARQAISAVLRRAKAESVGTEIADLTVCGAVPPYNAILGGKLVSMLAVSPSVVGAYRHRYGGYASQIASSMAGRPITRRSNLVFVGTTSLYGSGSSQYNRIKIPATVLGGERDIEFLKLGRSRSYGTAHLSNATVQALTRFVEQSQAGSRVNSIFGEGVNPKLRKLRAGIELLGWPAEDLLLHHRPRLIYGVPLVSNLRDYLLGVDRRPRYIWSLSRKDDVNLIADWWRKRWLSSRINSEVVLDSVAKNLLSRPVCHGARVNLPDIDEDEESDDSMRLF